MEQYNILSIVIPIYNLEKYITGCLESIYSQGCKESEYEIIVVNDGSTDHSSEIVKHYAEVHHNLILLDQKNSGVSVARNNGIEKASGKYVTFVDADDSFYPNSLGRLLDFVNNSNDTYDVLYCQSYIKNLSGCEKGYHNWEGKFLENQIYSGEDMFDKGYLHMGSVWAALYRHEFLVSSRTKFGEGIANDEDTIFNLLLYTKSPRIKFTAIPIYLVNEREGSASRSGSLDRVCGFRRNVEYLRNIRSHGVRLKLKDEAIDAGLYYSISQATNMYISIGGKSWKELYDILYAPSIWKMNVSWFPFHQRLKIAVLNRSFYFYYILLKIKKFFNDIK